jgi:hypothetical protein
MEGSRKIRNFVRRVSRFVAGRGGGRIWRRDDETIEAFEARVEAAAM